jgi:hypothetical protein
VRLGHRIRIVPGAELRLQPRESIEHEGPHLRRDLGMCAKDHHRVARDALRHPP